MQRFLKPFSSAWGFRRLIYSMAEREVLGRYKGSWLGLFWSLVTPILLLVVYMFVFGFIFKARWPQSNGVDEGFASLLFCGIIVYLMFSEILGRSPRLIVDNVNYVKRVVFPVDVLGWVAIGNSLFHFFISTVVLLAFVLFSGKGVGLSILMFPVLTLMFVLFLAGISWLVSALGVYIRDVTYVVGFLTTALTFLSPVFYPKSIVPEKFALVMDINPLTFYIENYRKVLVLNEFPDPTSFAIAAVVALGTFFLGYGFFQRVRRGFADVL
ncbi:ABC transporter permease [Neptunomonas marina]|uniref:Transport permease protein n=1 Tax=Neptunomonas marina TaxID=1815562 RepID=A0A437Q739_9GAMM|nr:ABC transporter permease [Neptunomonas marina]RVU30318.1 ABC transporter permease [Neptunomonas marina]